LSDTSENCWLVGSCNGVLCYVYHSSYNSNYFQYSWLKFYNPATKVESKELAYFEDHFNNNYFFTRYIFGYDILTDLYKVVALHLIGDGKTTIFRTVVRVFTFGDHAWRIIETFLVTPLRLDLPSNESNGVYFNGYVYWLALKNCVRANMSYKTDGITVDQFVIMSLNLSTEIHMELLPPQGFDQVPHVEPTLRVLNDSFCFSHDFNKTHFVIWKMEKFGGVEESFWTQLFKIRYNQYRLSIYSWLPLHISENNNTLILANNQTFAAFVINILDENSVERLSNKVLWTFSKDHVESLVSIC
jgi:F-box interacting protein